MSERTVYTIFGIVIVVGVELLRWLASAPAELCTVLTSIATMLMAGGPSIITRQGERGNARVGAMLALGGLALVALAAWGQMGCASTRVDGTTMGFRLRDDPKRPAPACLYRHTVDGVLLDEGALDDCPEVPVCREPSP